MKKKRFELTESTIAIAIGLVFVLAAVGVYIAAVSFVPSKTESDPGTGLYGERLERRKNTIQFIRENEDLLYALLGSNENDVICRQAMEETILESMVHLDSFTLFRTDYSGGSVLSSSNYQILYSPADPRDLDITYHSADVPWEIDGSGWKQMDRTHAYLERITDEFYYLYLGDP